VEITIQRILQKSCRLSDVMHIVLLERFPIPIKTCLNNLDILTDFNFIYTSCGNSWKVILKSL